MIDQLELEIRQLDGITYVAVGDRDGAVLIEVGVEPGADTEALRHEAQRVAATIVGGDVVVDLVEAGANGGDADGRVRLALVTGTTSGSVEVCLAHRDRRVSVESAGAGGRDVAAAVLAGLTGLGFRVPWVVSSVHHLDDELGSGTLVVLAEPGTDRIRRGLAGTVAGAESTARAVLSALNRFLEAAPRPHP